nr:M56 family metallopeptidase [Clostridia bacterium]
MTEIFIKLVNMSISAGWLILAVILMRLILAKAPKQLRVLMWGLVGLRLICPFTVKSVFSLIPSADVLTPDIMQSPNPAVNTGISQLNDVLNPVLNSSFAPDPSWSANPLQIVLPVIANIWFAVLIGFVLYTIVSCIVLDMKLRTAVRLHDNIYQSERVTSPFVFGIRKLNIYVPYGLGDSELEYVIMHENAHIRRLDYIIKPLGFAILALHWFNPLVWLAYVLFCRDIELACDERVVRGLDDIGKADYSQALLMCSSGRRVISACPLAFGEVGV